MTKGILTITACTLLGIGCSSNGDKFVGEWSNEKGQTIIIEKISEKTFHVKRIEVEEMFGTSMSTGYGDGTLINGELSLMNGVMKVVYSEDKIIFDGNSYAKNKLL